MLKGKHAQKTYPVVDETPSHAREMKLRIRALRKTLRKQRLALAQERARTLWLIPRTEPRVWKVGDQEPTPRPQLIAPDGRIWIYDKILCSWIVPGSHRDLPLASAQWDDMLARNGEMKEHL